MELTAVARIVRPSLLRFAIGVADRVHALISRWLVSRRRRYGAAGRSRARGVRIRWHPPSPVAQLGVGARDPLHAWHDADEEDESSW